MENPYMFTGKVERVRIRIDADQFTQIVDQFSDRFKVVGYDADESKYYDIELKVNLNSFTFGYCNTADVQRFLTEKRKAENPIEAGLKKQ